MNVLIVTEPNDIHAVLVKLALAKKGVSCDLLFSADMPSKQHNSIKITQEGYAWSSNELDSETSLKYDDFFDVIWWRRPQKPYIPDAVMAEDQQFVKRENSVYHDSLPFMLDNNAWWVNPIASHQKSRSKIIQLKYAHECGFKLPNTLVSNSPKEIKEFIKQNSETIYKTFYPQFWNESDGIKMVYTSKVLLDDLPSDKMLQMVPGIYQQYVEKKYELRVTCFGSLISAVKIDSQAQLAGHLDWRKIPSKKLLLEEYKLPDVLKKKLTQFMQKIGVVFGCFDFIVTPDDELVFLEINEQGQFLWVEEVLPQLHYLDMFTDFLIHKNFNFSWEKTGKSLSAAELDEEAYQIVDENMSKHVYQNIIKRVA